MHFIGQLLRHLRAQGMSLDESSVEGLEIVYRVKILSWQRPEIEGYMDIIDHQQLKDEDIFACQGSKLVKRHCGPQNPISTRRHDGGMPEAIYEPNWKGKNLHALTLSVFKEQFEWVRIIPC